MAGMLADQAAIVTGGGSGIGRAIARLFAQEGAQVVVADRNIDGAEETQRLIQEAGGEAVALPIDVRKEDSVKAMIDQAIATFGAIDILVNNAGIAGRDRPTIEQPLDHWQRVLAVNVDGPFLSCKHLGPHLIERRRGAVINIASISGLGGHDNGASYGPSKAAVANFTQQMAVEWGPYGIRVNAIAPGAIGSEWMLADFAAGRSNPQDRINKTPLRRIGEPNDIAKAALFLASDLASFVTGAILVVDGGATARHALH
ncbi:MAG TPA: SDR family oxidoreductase [Dehalococcoidia bacterium]|nr:SDR family oxidoreductase [Dehalococcoidia bacterium]